MEEALDNSSTSSSRSPWAILGAGLALVVAYEAVLGTGRIKPGHGVGQFQHNVVQAETVVFGQPPVSDVVVVGSSLSANLMTNFEEILPAENLAMGGESSLTGLALVDDAPHQFRRIVVEISHALNVVKDPKLTAMTESPFTSVAVRNIRAFRQEYQPANVLARYLAKSAGAGEQAHGLQPEETRGPIVADVIKLFSTPLSEKEAKLYADNLAAMREEIEAARAKGIECELFWPPIDGAVNASPREQAFFRMARTALPPSHFHWLEVNYTGATRTNDGYHLISNDAERYARALAVAVGP